MLGIILLFILGVALGYIGGYALAMLSNNSDPVGTLRIDRSDPDDSPYLFLELDDSIIVNKIAQMENVTFRVLADNYIS
jgi:hypothetical protein